MKIFIHKLQNPLREKQIVKRWQNNRCLHRPKDEASLQGGALLFKAPVVFWTQAQWRQFWSTLNSHIPLSLYHSLGSEGSVKFIPDTSKLLWPKPCLGMRDSAIRRSQTDIFQHLLALNSADSNSPDILAKNPFVHSVTTACHLQQRTSLCFHTRWEVCLTCYKATGDELKLKSQTLWFFLNIGLKCKFEIVSKK